MASTIAVRPRPRVPLRPPESGLRTLSIDALVFLLAIFGTFDVTLIGQLPYSEILIVLLLPAVLATRAKSIFRKEYRTIYLLMGLWLLSQVVTDAYRGMPFDNRMKGMARVVFFAIDLMVVSALVGGNLRRIKIFYVGLAIAGIAAQLVHPTGTGDFATDWKMGIGGNSATFFMLIGSYYYFRKGKSSVSIVILVAFAAAYLHFGARSGELIFLAAAVLLLPPFSPPMPGKPGMHLGRLAKLALLVGAAAVTIWLSETAIHWMVNAGLYTQYEADKFETQSAGKLGVIFGGRPEGPVAVRAIMDSPILGHGSYASDPKYNVLLQDYQYNWGYSDSDVAPDPDEPEGIPTHSHLTGAWVEAGVFGSILWFYLLALLCRSMFRLTEVRHPLAPLYLLTFIGLFWDILFSPFGNTRRVSEAFIIVLMVGLAGKPPTRIRTGLRARRGSPRPRQQPPTRLLGRPRPVWQTAGVRTGRPPVNGHRGSPFR